MIKKNSPICSNGKSLWLSKNKYYSTFKIIRILCRINETKFSNKDINEKINKILNAIKDNNSLAPCIEEAKKDASKKVLEKIQKYFP